MSIINALAVQIPCLICSFIKKKKKKKKPSLTGTQIMLHIKKKIRLKPPPSSILKLLLTINW